MAERKMSISYNWGQKTRDEDSPTKLTEFAPLSSDVRPSGGILARLFGRSKGGVSFVIAPRKNIVCFI